MLSEKIEIGENETAGELYDKMKEAGAELLLKTIKGISEGNITEAPQLQTSNLELQTLHHAPKLTTETSIINWNKTTDEVHNLIRGLSPYPTAFTTLENKKLKIYKAEKMIQVPASSPGNFETDGKTYLRFACSNGYINILELQLEGKKRMGVEDFLRGYRFAV